LEEQAIINILKINPTITQEEIAKQINKSPRTVKTHMMEMQKKGLIERIRGKRNGEWVVNN
jgi:DNA-binding Lrp family transcriptional regulator